MEPSAEMFIASPARLPVRGCVLLEESILAKIARKGSLMSGHTARLSKWRGAGAQLVLGASIAGMGCSDAEPVAPTEAPPSDQSFQKVTLNGAPGEPMGLAVLPDGRVLHTTRSGRLWLHEPSTGLNRVAGVIPVYQHDEEGLQGIAIDADFERNQWVYLYYSPPLATPLDDPTTPDVNEGDAPPTGSAPDWAPFAGVMRLSRFRLQADQLDLSSEQTILDVPVDRGICCHIAGHIDFDAQGNLYLSTGDDTNPFASDGFNPIDERPSQHPAFDAQRSAANTNDLRGKLLRIRVSSDGSYSIPPGNLFPPDTPQTRPEIYAMGLRNPFRFSINRQTGDLYLADYSPDATAPDPARGPAGQGKWTIVRKPGNYGWPYCATARLPYADFDFDTMTAGAPFDCQAPVNDSPHNTGLRQLPPVVQPDVWYGATASAEFPELGVGGVGPMAGPAYEYSSQNPSVIKWPSYFDGVPLFYEWTRDSLAEFRLDRRGRLGEIRPLLASIPFENPMDMQFGPDGALYVLEYGEGYYLENPEAQLSRIDFVQGNFSPVPVATAAPTVGRAPLSVALSSAGTSDPDSDAISLFWDFDADGVVDSTEPNPTLTLTTNGVYTPTLRVVDSTGRSATTAARIVVGNDVPIVSFVTPTAGEPFSFGQTVNYQVQVTDDQPVDCARVEVTYVLGHEQHGHPLSTALGCSGSFETALDSGHAGAAGLAAVFVASYTDAPSEPGIPPLNGQGVVALFETAVPIPVP
jgi:cytochrome c